MRLNRTTGCNFFPNTQTSFYYILKIELHIGNESTEQRLLEIGAWRWVLIEKWCSFATSFSPRNWCMKTGSDCFADRVSVGNPAEATTCPVLQPEPISRDQAVHTTRVTKQPKKIRDGECHIGFFKVVRF